jgi:hypothetical protein
MLNNRPYVNLGVGGQTSTQIAARVGALPSGMTVAGNTLPGDSTPVGMSNLSIELLSTPADDVARSKPGTLCSVHGVLRRTAVGGPPSTAENYSFGRDVSGATTVCAAGSPFVADAEGYDQLTALIWVGGNNYDEVDTVVSDVRSIIQWLKPANPHFVVLSLIKGNFSYEYPGNPGAQHVDQINASLKAEHPDNFVDIATPLVNAYDPSQPQDVIDHNNKVVPTSLRADLVHLNDKGYGIVAEQVRAYLQARNW